MMRSLEHTSKVGLANLWLEKDKLIETILNTHEYIKCGVSE